MGASWPARPAPAVSLPDTEAAGGVATPGAADGAPGVVGDAGLTPGNPEGGDAEVEPFAEAPRTRIEGSAPA
ncbi:MAG: hypothetical protein ACK49H_06910, partial [Burkholderiales bacterium]